MDRRTALQCLPALAAIGASPVAAQDFPARPIKLIVPLPAGSASDVVARAFAESVARAVGQPVVVENKAGADGLIAGIEARRAAPDGHTLFFATNSPMMVAPALKKSPPYDPTRDFTPILDVGRYTYLFVVHPDVPARSLAELGLYAKANPDKLAYGTGNTTGLIACAEFASMTGARMIHVPFKGEPQAMVDLLAGRLQMMLATAGAALPQIRDGKLRPLAVGLNARLAELPDVPTLTEAGFPQLSISAWAGLYGPPGMPRDRVERINAEFAAAATRSDVRAVLARQAFVFTGSTPEGLQRFTREQFESFKSKLGAIGLEAE